MRHALPFIVILAMTISACAGAPSTDTPETITFESPSLESGSSSVPSEDVVDETPIQAIAPETSQAPAPTPEPTPAPVAIVIREALLVKTITNLPDGALDGYRVYTRDGLGRVIEESAYDAGKGEVVERIAYDIDAQGRVLLERHEGPQGKPDYSVHFEYTPGGALLAKRVRDSLGNEISRIEYATTQEGRVTRTLYAKGVMSGSVIEYTEGGLLVEERFIDAAGRAFGGTVYEYGSDMPLPVIEALLKGRSSIRPLISKRDKAGTWKEEYSYEGTLLTAIRRYGEGGVLESTTKIEYTLSGDTMVPTRTFVYSGSGRLRLAQNHEYSSANREFMLDAATSTRVQEARKDSL